MDHLAAGSGLAPLMGTMSVLHWVTVLTCAGQLALAILAGTRVTRSTLALPIGLMSLVMSGWNFAALGFDVTGHLSWRYLDTSISVFTGPTALHFFVAFVGRRRTLRWLVTLGYVFAGTLSVATASAFFLPGMADFPLSTGWATVHLLLVAFSMGACLVLLRGHLRDNRSDSERTRTWLVVTSLLIGGAFGSSELLADLGVPVPRMGSIATFTALALVAVVVFRFQLFERDLSLASGVYALAAASIAMLGYFFIMRAFAGNTAVRLLGIATLTVLVLAAGYRIVNGYREERERMERLAVLGRLSSQLAHDLKNPLAALKGAVQFLQEERRLGRSIDEHEAFLELMATDIERLGRLIDKYRRLATIEPHLVDTDLNALVREVAGLAPLAATNVEVTTELAGDLPPCPLDQDLIVATLENVVQNAIEAMPEGGTLSIRTSLDERTEPPHVVVAISDTGEGMGARVRERAFEELYTTKARGSGLGLPFCKRVVEAHGGSVELASREGEGTTVRLALALRA